MSLITRLVGSLVRRGQVHLILPDGSRETLGPGGAEEVTVRITDRRALAQLARYPRLALGELYMENRLVIEQGVTEASASTIWRWLHDRSLKPWQQRSWIFPRDRDFQPKAGRVLDLYARRFEGRLLHPGEYVICADEKSQLQNKAKAMLSAIAQARRVV